MKKEFNVTGICRPAKHYMADVSAKVADVIDLVERGKYFTINRPRQYGKTTTLYTIADYLEKKSDYLVFNISFEGLDDSAFGDAKRLAQVFLNRIARYAQSRLPELAAFIAQKSAAVHDLDTLSDAITDIANRSDKALVLIIDEVDSSSNNELFVRFLAMLRNKYLAQDREKTFYSVILAGLYDVKSLDIMYL